MKITKILKHRSKKVKSYIKLPPSSVVILLVHNTNKLEFQKCYKTAAWQVYSQKNFVHARKSKLSLVDSNTAGFQS